ncbi:MULTISPECIES: GTPase [unclassified Streptomyces]|uniref:GTPase n=1 Tax=unclassified Streptomyces TaxID=2593676 RepID=UPI0022580354|nr:MULTISPECIES: GTPase [unclassified Streptomyces]WSP55098.1 50S ribosome-binding GTPase [Streptomyces sp. NBC_01241]WSU24161.1 50S ribosome-binding GTPase [Streptomyces sp. NBC_01108]MCX4797452.1 50S ribosome-binding GTPase [Streptomyces sp. NBC_01242]WSJ38735.1 50S ribosome-binding GTPase [Streptomyces sp. NBC_01321]WSP65027.1 50S ribosome-binding GTPase [Streptomyces sp. NBC_01240]
MTAVIDEGTGRGESPAPHEDSDRPGRTPDRPTRVPEAGGDWNDGLIARRAAAMKADPGPGTADDDVRTPQVEAYVPSGGPLRPRLDALRELVGLSRARLDGATLAEAGRVLDEAAARRRLSSRHTVVAIAGATGSGKSALFNSLAGVQISETGLRRPTTAAPIACSWTDGAAGLLDRLAIPGRLRRRPQQGGTDADEALQGLVLVDLPDHDSAAPGHREQVDRVLALVDAVIWVVDPEKYADAALHERYLRPLAGHAEVTFVVLNQIDRLPGDAADQVLDDLRRLLDEDGMALGEHGEPGATVMSLSALTGDGVGELREVLGRFVQERTAAARRLSADVDAAAARLRPVYVAEGRPGLGERAREEFADRLAEAVGAAAAGQAAEREWRRNAGRACRTPWLRLWRWYESARRPGSLECPALPAPVEEELTARQRVEQAVRTVADEAADGLPGPWAQAVREAAVNGADGLPEALDELVEKAGRDEGRERPASSSPGGGTGGSGGGAAQGGIGQGGSTVMATRVAGASGVAHSGRVGGKPPRPRWWPAAVLAQASMTLLQIFGALWLVGQIVGVLEPGFLTPALVMLAGVVGGPLVEWSCAAAARGPARRYGQEAERQLREAAAACGRARVLDPVAAELVRYREVRERYVAVTEFSTTVR